MESCWRFVGGLGKCKKFKHINMPSNKEAYIGCEKAQVRGKEECTILRK